MTLEAKKIQTMSWILSLEDESVMDELLQQIEVIKDSTSNKYYSSFDEIRNRKFDLATAKKEQGYKKPTKEELNLIAVEADLEETTEELLIDLKSLD